MVSETVKQYQPKVGMMSCVGVMRMNFPLDFGNYFSLLQGPYVINMWAENLEEYVRRTNITKIECTVFEDSKGFQLAYVTDPSIPKEWLNNKLCVTGQGWGSRELCEHIHRFVNKEVVSQICGCELPEQSPRISQGYTPGTRKVMHMCHRCKRRWEDTY